MNAPDARATVTLDDKYRIREGWIYLSGTQALVRLPLQQRLRDAAEGKRTGGYISGYRGSPLGRYDMELWREEALLREHGIHFRAAVNEDLAATALWGAQYVGQFPGAKVDGVFGIWYGKGPGVDRSGDVFRHANGAGTGPLGGVIALAGDDHGAKSSTICNFSDQIFIATGMPVLYPSNTQELLDFGLHGIAMSRHSGCWVGMKVVMDVVEGGGSIHVAPDSPRIVLPAVPPAPTLGPAGWNIRRMDMPLPQEDRLYNHKLFAALDYIRANGLNRVSHAASDARIGILAAGKAYQDVLQAVAELGLDAAQLAQLGVRIGKIGVIWPLDPMFVGDFAHGLDTLLVVEEKRSLIESQLKAILYDRPADRRPRILGRHDGAHEWAPDRGETVLPGTGEISPPLVARVIAGLLRQRHPDCALAPIAVPVKPSAPGPLRMPSFCSGCPHNRSTRVPEGSRALAGIGCHTIAMLQNPAQTMTVSHMGGEGAMWLGQQPFTEEKHVFANMGDGTYFHSGFLAIRQAVAAKVPITYKLLVNGFVSMTGGQPIDGELGVPRMVGELMAEGVNEIVVVTDEPAKYAGAVLPHGVPVHPREALDAVQRRCREFPGVSVILYEQPCATERRRLRKRGKWPDPEVRTYIHPLLCEGCGDCGKASNCLSVEPLETPFGRKRKINQSTCNKDLSCVEGFCPSFVTLEGARPRRAAPSAASAVSDLPMPPEPAIARPAGAFSILITGIGGTGVVTIGQVIGMAAHLDGLRCSVLDVTGLAQKYGAVLSHVRFAPEAGMLHATRIAAGEADTVIGCDLIVTAGDEAASRMRAGKTRVAVCNDLIPTAEFARNPDWQVDRAGLLARIAVAAGGEPLAVEGIRLATALMGDAIAANMFMLGLAWQRGWVPLTRDAILRAIELNGVQVGFNQRCFELGRAAAHDPESVARHAAPASVVPLDAWRNESLPQIVARRATYLADYQDTAWAERYRRRVAAITEKEGRLGLGDELATAVARNLFKLMAGKDEWEVARLLADPGFLRELEDQFEGDYRIRFHLGGWPFGDASKVGAGGTVQKRRVGPWLLRVLGFMARHRHWRDSWRDPFRHSVERQLARKLLADYEADIDRWIATLEAGNHGLAVKLAALPEKIRGYGHVRAAAASAVAREREELLNPPATLDKAA